jgi:osmoprotectant transport system substrate-binding protein
VAVVGLAAVAITLGACGSSSSSSSSSGSSSSQSSSAGGKPGKGKGPVTIGTQQFTEAIVIGQLWAKALEAKGYTVHLQPSIGALEVVNAAFESGRINTYPAYTGETLETIGHETGRHATSAQQTYAAAKAFEEKHGRTLLAMTPFYDVDAIAVLPSYAKQHGLVTLADIKKAGSAFTLGARPEFQNQFVGLVGMRKLYGLSAMGFKPLAFGLRYNALDAGSVQGADVFSTDGQLLNGHYVLLKDPQNLFGFQNIAPPFSQKFLTAEGPALAQTLNAVDSKLTIKAMQQMNAAVDLDKDDPTAVASAFLKANGLS